MVEVPAAGRADNESIMNLPIPDVATLQAMLQALKDPRQLHAIVGHLPIAVAAFFPLLLLVQLGTGNRSHVLRWTTVVGYFAAAVVGWYATESGHMAVAWEHAAVARTPEALAVLETHEKMGDIVPIALAVVGVLMVLTAIPRKLVSIPVLVLALAAGCATAVWVGVTAHHGGTLVYMHGFNTPASANNAVALPEVPAEVEPKLTEPVPAPAPDDDDEPRKKGFFGIPTN